MALFRLAKIGLVFWTYFTIAEPPLRVYPTVIQMALLALIYLDHPLGALVSFSPENFAPSSRVALSIARGSVLVTIAAAILICYRRYWRDPPPHTVYSSRSRRTPTLTRSRSTSSSASSTS